MFIKNYYPSDYLTSCVCGCYHSITIDIRSILGMPIYRITMVMGACMVYREFEWGFICPPYDIFWSFV